MCILFIGLEMLNVLLYVCVMVCLIVYRRRHSWLWKWSIYIHLIHIIDKVSIHFVLVCFLFCSLFKYKFELKLYTNTKYIYNLAQDIQHLRFDRYRFWLQICEKVNTCWAKKHERLNAKSFISCVNHLSSFFLFSHEYQHHLYAIKTSDFPSSKQME